MFGPIVLAGHIDTVSPDLEKYKTDPYQLTIQDGKGYGLGSIDMKSFVAVILDNIDKLKSLSTPIIIALTTDEETELLCIENVIDVLKQLSIIPKFTIVGEPTNSQFCASANGCYEYKLEIFGKACHSSQPQNGINSICVIAKIISYIEKLQNEFSLTSNCGVIKGGDVINRVPDLATLYFDIRSTYPQQVDVFLSLIQEKLSTLEEEYGCKIALNQTLKIPPLEDKANSLVCKFALENNISINQFSGGCEAGYFQNYSGDAILFGVGDLSLAHKPNEYVVIEEYKNYSQTLMKFLNYLDKNL